MLTMVEITNVLGSTLQLPLMDASAGYVVMDIEGLDPVKATLTSSPMAQADGQQFQNARRDTRNITMKIGLEPDYVTNSVASLRSALYDYLMPMANIQVGFYIDGVLFANCQGQVESYANSMFSTAPEVDISIICYDPDFYAPASATLSSVTAISAPIPESIGIADGTFETGVGDWSPTAVTLTQSSADHHSGSQCAVMTTGSSAPPSQVYFRPIAANAVPVTPDVLYGTSLWLKGTVSGTAHAAIDWFDVNGTYISTSSGPSSGVFAGGWTKFTVTDTAPAGAFHCFYGPTWNGAGTNQSLSCDDIEFDVYTVDPKLNSIMYEGTSDAGVIFTLNVNEILTNFVLYNITPDNSIQTFEIDATFIPGDVITVTSIPGSKSVTLNRSGVVSSILYDMVPSSTWITLQRGENRFRAYVSGTTPIPYTLTYTPKYGGL